MPLIWRLWTSAQQSLWTRQSQCMWLQLHLQELDKNQVHKVKCNCAGKRHMLAENAAEQKLDARMQQHFNEGKRVTTLGQKSDSCAKHFVIPQFNSMSRCQTQKHLLQHHLAMLLNQCSQQFASKSFTMCAKQRIETLMQSRPNLTHNFSSTVKTNSSAPTETTSQWFDGHAQKPQVMMKVDQTCAMFSWTVHNRKHGETNIHNVKSSGLRNNSNGLLQISPSLLFDSLN